MACCSKQKFMYVTTAGDDEVADSGDDLAANSSESNWFEDDSKVLRVKTLHISSPILAAKSPLIYKLFSNDMIESEQRHVTLRINAFEEVALMELLKFVYSYTCTSNTAPALLDLLMAADKFEVASCMTHCSREKFSHDNIVCTTISRRSF